MLSPVRDCWIGKNIDPATTQKTAEDHPRYGSRTDRASRQMRQTWKDYRDCLGRFRESKSHDPAPARYPEMREIAVNELLMHAERTPPHAVSILSGNLEGLPVSDEAIELLQRITRVGTVKVLLLGDGSPWEGALSYVPGVELRVQPFPKPDFEGNYLMLSEPAAFVFTGRIPYQASPETHRNIGREIPMRICFNNPDDAANVRTYFETLWHTLDQEKSPQPETATS